MVLPILVILLVIAYVVLDRSGLLEEFAKTIQRTREDWPPSHPEMEDAPPPDPESEGRLEVFEDFIEGLEPKNEDEDEE